MTNTKGQTATKYEQIELKITESLCDYPLSLKNMKPSKHILDLLAQIGRVPSGIKTKPVPPLSDAVMERISAELDEIEKAWAMAIPNKINEILKNISIADYIKNTSKGIPIPIEKLDTEIMDSSHDQLEHYVERRAILSLMTLCLKIGPDYFSDNGALTKKLREHKNFLTSVKIEPSMIQTDLGIEVLKTFSFWFPNTRKTLGLILNPKKKKGKYVGSSGDEIYEGRLLEAQVQPTKFALLLIALRAPKEARALPDERMLSILTRLGYAVPELNTPTFIKIREKIFKKRATN